MNTCFTQMGIITRWWRYRVVCSSNCPKWLGVIFCPGLTNIHEMCSRASEAGVWIWYGMDGMGMDLTPQLFMWDIGMYYPLKKSNT